MKKESLDWLSNEDRCNFDDRVARLDWLAKEMPKGEHVAFHAGLVGKYLFEEAKYCFVYGQYLATIMLGFSFIERTIAALFYESGRNDLQRASARTLLQEAHGSGWLPDTDFERLNEARERRNPIVHFRPPLEEDTIEYRMISENELAYEVIEADARAVMIAVMRLLSRHTY